MTNLFNLSDYKKGECLFAALAVCLQPEFYDADDSSAGFCGHRWVAGVPKDTSLFKLECPDCGAQNSFASILPSEYLHKFSDEFPRD